MRKASDTPSFIPYWIGGRPYLTVAESVYDVADPCSGQVYCRVPLAGEDEVSVAVEAARDAQPAWSSLSVGDRDELIARLSVDLHDYADHFAGLVAKESGVSTASASAEVEAAIAALTDGRMGEGGLVALLIGPARPLASLAAASARVLRAGGVIVCKPSPATPGSTFAFCELTSRVGFPPGVINLVHGDRAAVEALGRNTAVDRVEVAAEGALARELEGIVARCGKPVGVGHA